MKKFMSLVATCTMIAVLAGCSKKEQHKMKPVKKEHKMKHEKHMKKHKPAAHKMKHEKKDKR